MEDVCTELAKYLDTRGTMILAQVCKESNKSMYKDWNNRTLGSFTLRTQQYLFCKMTEEAFKTQQKCIISASLGWGKTYCSVYFFMNFFKGNVLIIVPPATCKVWIEALTKINLITPDPSNSPVLVFHNDRERHRKYYPKDCDNMFRDHRIVLTTDLNSNKFRGKPDLIIQDEYHKTDKKGKDYTFQPNFGGCKLLGLTGENIEASNNTKVLMLRDETFKEKIPEIRFHYYNIDNGRDDSYAKYGVHIEDLNDYEEEYREKFFECLKSKNKAVICTDRGKIGDAVRSWVEQLSEYKVFELKSSTQIINMFMKYVGKAILFIGSNNNEGINIFAEHIIFVKPDLINVNRIVQSIGRLVRPGNQHKIVTVNYIVGGKMGSLKALYASAYTHTNWHFNYLDTPSTDLLMSARSIMGLLGYFGDDYLKFPLVDASVVFDHIRTRERYQKVLEWWKVNHTSKSVLTEDYVDALYA